MRVLVLTLLAGLASGVPAAAAPAWLGGVGPPLVLVAGTARAARPGDTLTVEVVVAGRYPGDPEAAFHLGVPPGLGLLSGDTARAGRMSAITGNYTFRLAPRDTGSFVVEGRLHVEAGNARDDAAMEMAVTVDSDTVVVDRSRYTRLESTRGGRRFRYGGWWLVPLDVGEPSVVEKDIEARGSRARATDSSAAVCPRCPAAAIGDSARFVVIVGPDGRARDWKFMGLSGPSVPLRRSARRFESRIASAAEAALKRWSFEPARWNGQAVSDWLYVSIPVRRGP